MTTETTETKSEKRSRYAKAMICFGAVVEFASYLLLTPIGQRLPIIAFIWLLAGILIGYGWCYGRKD